MGNTISVAQSSMDRSSPSDMNNADTLWKTVDRLIANIVSAPDSETKKRCQQMVPITITDARKALRIDGDLKNLSISRHGKCTTPEDVALFRRIITETRFAVKSAHNPNQ